MPMVPEPASATVQGAQRGARPLLWPRFALLPLVVASHDAVTAVAFGVANGLVLLAVLPLLASLRPRFGAPLRGPASALVVAGAVTALGLVLQATLPALHARLAPLLPLLAVGALILLQHDGLAGPGAGAALRAAARVAAAGALALLACGALRELLGRGTLFAGAGALLGLPGLEASLARRGPWLLASLPAGGLLLLGLLSALLRRRPGDAA
jgi:electron transport complex protein RnfE